MNKSHFSSLLVPTQVLETQNRQKKVQQKIGFTKGFSS